MNNKTRNRNQEFLDYMKNYINTYDNQKYWEEYNHETIINDILYGLGVGLFGEKYSFFDGYTEFKKYLIKFLKEQFCNCKSPQRITTRNCNICSNCHKEIMN